MPDGEYDEDLITGVEVYGSHGREEDFNSSPYSGALPEGDEVWEPSVSGVGSHGDHGEETGYSQEPSEEALPEGDEVWVGSVGAIGTYGGHGEETGYSQEPSEEALPEGDEVWEPSVSGVGSYGGHGEETGYSQDPSEEALPEGDTVWVGSVGAIGTYGDQGEETGYSIEPSESALPEGDTVWLGSVGAIASYDDHGNESGHNGNVALGSISQGGEVADGQIFLYYQGELTHTQPITGTIFSFGWLPSGMLTGESMDGLDGDNQLLVVTEQGGVASSEFEGTTAELHAAFSQINVNIIDANGDPVPADTVAVGFDSTTTDDDGVATFSAAGETEVYALEGSITETLDLDSNSSEMNVTYQYAGLRGKVETPGGQPIAGKQVLIHIGSETIASTVTDESGEYEIPTVPQETEFIVEADPYHRPGESRGAGEWVTRHFPSYMMRKGDPDDPDLIQEDDLVGAGLEVIDAETRSPIESVEVEIGDFRIETGENGRAAAILDPEEQEEVTVRAGEDRRYRRRELTLEIEENQPIEADLPLDRYVKSGQK